MKKCSTCEVEFKTYPWKMAKFCSVRCRALFNRIRLTKNCTICNEEFETILSYDRKYCSKKCYKSSSNKLIKKCPICEVEFRSFPSLNQKYCSNKCKCVARKTTMASSLVEKARIKSHDYLKSIGEDPETSSLYK